MTKSSVIIFLVLVILKVQAQNYLISFAGAGDTTVVSTIKVFNLTSGDSVTLNGGDVLHLTALVEIGKLDKNDRYLQLYPNPMESMALLTFFAPVNGVANISIVDLSGKTVYQTGKLLSTGTHSFRVTDIKQGSYLLKVTGKKYNYSTKLVSLNNLHAHANIKYVTAVKNTSENQLKSTAATIDMLYKEGDRLLFKSTSGKFTTIVTDMPSGSKTITFNFVACTDADTNNYSTVTIGKQVWMAENLKTTLYNDGTTIPLVTASSDWAFLSTPGYCWYNNYTGALYNWYAVNTEKLAPVGWHVPSDDEWKQLETELGMTQEQADATGSRGTNQGDQLKNQTGWNSNGSGSNTSGFSALPGGCRYPNGSFYVLGAGGYWWSSTQFSPTNAWDRVMSSDNTIVYRFNNLKTHGFSVRCVRGYNGKK